MITDSWLQYSSTSNRFNNTYLQGFLDVSGNIILRNGSLNIKNGDISMNGNLYLSANNINLSSTSSYNGLIQLNNSISTTNSYQPIEFIVNMISLNTNTGITNWREVRMSNNGQYWIAVSTQVNEVYISSNYGTTFTQVTNSDTSGCYTVGISGNGQYMVIPYFGTNTSGSGTYLLSSDYGANWTKKTYTITTIDAITSIAISNTGQYMTMAASAIISSYNTSNSAGRLYRSTDYGITFTAIGSQYNNLINVAMSSDGLYQTAVSFYSNTQGSGNNNAGAYVKSTNYGASWTASQVISGVSSRRANKAIAISSTGQYQTIVGESGLAYTSCFIANSSDYGDTFTYNTNAPTDVSYGCISMSSDGKYQIVGVGRKGESSPSGYLYISTDYGITWTINTSTTNLWSSIAMSQYGEYIAGATYANGMYLTTNNLYDSSYGINVSNPSIKMNLLVNGVTIGFPINNGSLIRSICVGNNTLKSSLKISQGGVSDLSINVFGYNTANTLESGCRNTVFGAYADLTTSDTSGVTIVGYNAKAGPMNSTAIGSQSYVSGVNSIAIGYLTNVTANNTVRLGNTLVTTVDTSASILTSSTIKNSSGYLANMWSGSNMFPENTINITTISGLSSTPSNKFFGGALGDDGYIYLSCDSSGVVGVINPANDTISYFTSVGSAIGICKAANGKFYGAPYTANQAVLEINPVTRTTTTFGTTNNVTGQYWGCVLAPNGKIYCIPYNVTNNIGIIDASGITPVFSTLSISTPAGSSPYFNGGVLAPNGKIYCIPYNATVVGVIDTTVTPNTFSTFGTVTGTAPYYSGGVLGPNGKIYCIPYSVTNIGIIDTTANTFSTSGSIAGSTKYNGGILAPNNKIYCIPATAGNVGVIDVSGPTPDFTTFGSVATASEQYAGGVLGPNGKIYCVPRNATNVGIIKCGIPTEELWMLGPEFNKY
jgi:hypothetical protein